MKNLIRENYIKVENNLRLYIRDLGKGQPILLIHGWPFNHCQFEYQILNFASMGYRCIAIDMRGAGKSDSPWLEYSYSIFADDIKKVIDYLNIDNIILAGFSIGGAMVLHYLAKYNQYKVQKALLLAAAAPLFTQREDFNYGFKKKEIDRLIEQSLKDRPSMLEGFTDILFNKKHSTGILNWIKALGLEMSANATIEWLKVLRDSDLRSDMSKISIETAIFHGIKDKICPFELAKILNQNIKSSKLVVFKESGHGLWYDEVEKFNREFIDFIKK